MSMDTKEAKKLLLKELKQAFPNIKFKTRTDGGRTLNISYERGVPAREVEAITRKYQAGSFDGMVDSYEYKEDRAPYAVYDYVFVKRDSYGELHKNLRQLAHTVLEEMHGSFSGLSLAEAECARIGNTWGDLIMGNLIAACDTSKEDMRLEFERVLKASPNLAFKF